MTNYALFGVNADTLDEARQLVERALDVALEEGEGLFNGGIYFSLPFPDRSIMLRNNVDLDDTEMEFGGLHEPEHRDFKCLLYLEELEVNPSRSPKLEALPRYFIKLRVA